jgi:GNAT superfamily N-acetyltransferase
MNNNHPAFLQPELLCRPALPMDTPAVLALASLIWDGEDYLPYVWQDWLDDPGGILLVGEYDGKIVATGKLTRLAEHSWWLEGLRIHPGFEKRGFATHMFGSLLDACARLGGGMARLVTSSNRLAVHRMCARFGFTQVGNLSAYRAPTRTAENWSPWPFIPLTTAQAAEAVHLAVNCTSTSLTGRFMDMGWQWQEPDPDRLGESAAQGQAWWWQNRLGLLTVWIDEEEDERTLSLQLAACPAESLLGLLADYRLLGGQLGYPEVRAMLPVDTDVVQILEEAGYHRTWEKSLFIYEKSIPVV